MAVRPFPSRLGRSATGTDSFMVKKRGKISRSKMMQEKQETVPLPGVLATLATGFDFTAKHFWLVLLPALVDIFFWLGPRLSFRPLIERWVGFAQQQGVPMAGIDLNVLLTVAPLTNLFSSLSVPFLGVPALMMWIMPEKTPVSPVVWELNSGWLWAGLFLVFSVAGLALTAVYYGLIVRSLRGKPGRYSFPLELLLNWLKLLGLGLLFLTTLFVIYMPLLVVGVLVGMFSFSLASLVILAGPMLAIWLVIYFFFAPQGIFWHGRPLLAALWESMQLVRRYFLSATGLLLMIFILNRLLDNVLLIADDGSWLTFASIVGHAYISTAMIVATLIFYRDRYADMRFQAQQTGSSSS